MTTRAFSVRCAPAEPDDLSIVARPTPISMSPVALWRARCRQDE